MKKVLLVALAIGGFTGISFAQESKKANNDIRIKTADPNRPKAVKQETDAGITESAPEKKVKTPESVLTELGFADNQVAEIAKMKTKFDAKKEAERNNTQISAEQKNANIKKIEENYQAQLKKVLGEKYEAYIKAIN